jgi:hypothetical protein
MLMRADDGAIDQVDRPIKAARGLGLLLHSRQEVLEETRTPPAVKTAGHGAPRPIPLRQIPPGSAGAEDPEDAVEDGTVVMGGSPNTWLLGWEQGLEPLPLCVGQIASVHTP